MAFSLHFSEKPATNEEKEIAKLMTILSSAFRLKNAGLLDHVYASDARITSLRDKKKILDRDEYMFQTQSVFDTIRDVSFTDILIRVNGKTAVISCLSSTLVRGNTAPTRTRRQFTCKKESGGWKIVEALYL